MKNFKWKFDRTRLLAVREINDMTQQQIAEKLGKTRQMYQQWESGERTPNVHSLVKLSEIYNVKPQYFFTENVTQSVEQGE